jgi:hypothetical protein
MRFVGFSLSILSLLAGCAAQTNGDSAADRGDEISSCGTVTPRAPICNIEKCTADGWTPWPIAAGAACTINGQAGRCDGGKTLPNVIEPLEIGRCIPTETLTILPKFYVLSVLYAPPGTAGSGARSSVSYSTSSSTGTETSISHQFKQGYNVSAEVHLGDWVTLDGSAGWSDSNGTSDSLELRKTTTTTISDSGPPLDGIDHDDDIIYLWMNPAVGMVANGSNIQWTLTTDGAAMDIQWVSVGQLKNPSTIPAGLLQKFAARGIVAADYQTMLDFDPFALGAAMDPARFVQAAVTLPYEPPLRAGDNPPSITYSIDNETTSSHGTTYEKTWDVGFSVKIGSSSGATSWFGSVSASSDFTWTSSGSTTVTTSSTQSASVTMTGPSFGYAGPTDMAVYVDTLFNTFAFVPIGTGTPVSATGLVTDVHGVALANKDVVLTSSTGALHARTGARGEYRIFGAPHGAAQIAVSGVSRSVMLGSTPIHQDFVVAP